jgi:hypothetical protein
VVLATWPVARASAYSDPNSYDEATEEAGGGGRWFTGSSADGYGCDVCHEGGTPAALTIEGLPTDGFVAGASYEVSLRWPATLEDLALVAEFTDETRMSAGTLALPRPEAYTEEELCGVDEGGAPATAIYTAVDERNLIGVVDCGARVARFKWTAPEDAAGTIWFNAGLVASDADATPMGDGVTLAKRALPPVGGSAERMIATSGCSAVQGGATGSSWLAALVLGSGWVLGWRRRIR